MGENVVPIQHTDTEKQRSTKQNRAAHKWFRQVAQELDAAGYDAKEIFHGALPPTEYMVKDRMFVPVAEALYGKSHTSELTTDEFQSVVNTLERLLAEKFDVSTLFPAKEL